MHTKTALIQYRKSYLSKLVTGEERYKQLQRILAPFDRKELHRVTQKHLSDALDVYSGATRNRYRSALTHFWKWSRSKSLTDLTPTLLHDREVSRSQVMSMDQLREMYVAAEKMGDWRGFCELLILTGQRTGEIMKIRHQDVMGDEWHNPFTKNGQAHVVHLCHRAQAVLVRGTPWVGMKTTAHIKRRWFDAAGLNVKKFRLHDIRRSFVTHMADAGVDENLVDRILNHQAAATQGGVKGVYNRAKRSKERRQIMYDWEMMLLGSHKITSTPDKWKFTHAGTMTAHFGTSE